LADFMTQNCISYLFGSASIPMHDGGLAAHSIMQELRGDFMSKDELRVTPKLALPESDKAIPSSKKTRMPPLLKAYMRLGAQICGEPCWDPAFGCADIFILLDVQHLQARYHRHFIQRQMPATAAEIHADNANPAQTQNAATQRMA